MMNWLEAHPQFYGFLLALLLALAGGVVGALSRPRSPEEYAAMPPKLAKFFKLWRCVFPDGIKFANTLREPPLTPTQKRSNYPPPVITEAPESGSNLETIPVPKEPK